MPPAIPQASDPWTSEFGRDFRRAWLDHPRCINPKHFYDTVGSRLFDQICELPEYYPTRTEVGILRQHAGDMAALMGPHAEVVEFGAGSCAKVGVLLAAMQAPARYLPIDISGEHLRAAAQALQAQHPDLAVQPVVGDYTADVVLPSAGASASDHRPPTGRRIGFFPGSTLGNFSPAEALAFLRRAARLLRGGALLLGADLVKRPEVLHAAYNDARGVTATFNLNLLARANRELGTSIDLASFAHSAFYNPPKQRIEMHLVSLRRQRLAMGSEQVDLSEGDSLHTENSYKFTVEGLRAVAAQAGFQPGPVWMDPQRFFSVHWLEAPAP
jgi:dimethylhistidine N-methyltransferase